MITGYIKSEKSTAVFTEVSWTIDKLNQKLDEDDTLQSDPFTFAGQEWRLLLAANDVLDGRYIEFIISRITLSNVGNPVDSVLFWNGGILDTNGASQYRRSGFAHLETTFEEWMTVADWPGPEYAHLYRRKDFFMPEDRLTVVIQLRLDSGCAQTDVQHAAPVESSADDVVICVKEKTFHVPSSILESVSEVLSAKIQCSEWNGDNIVMDFPDCDPKAFEFFISFAYSNELGGLTRDVIKDVYHIADKFDVTKLKEACVRQLLFFLDGKIDSFSVCDVLGLALRYHDEVLKEKATGYFLKHFQEVVRSSQWLEFLAKHTKFANDLILRYLDELSLK